MDKTAGQNNLQETPSQTDKRLPDRRRMLAGLAAGAGLFGVSASATPATGQVGSWAAYHVDQMEKQAPEEFLFSQARLKNYRARRSASWDRTGGNDDSVPLEAGGEAVLLDARGAGVVTHLWFTINSRDINHLKNLVLRAWWDDEPTPSVEVPIGDFFGLGLGEYFVYQSELLVVAPVKALNAYFKMPFGQSARMTLTNEGSRRADNVYFAIDYVLLHSLPEELGRFHAQYRQATPCEAEIHDWTNEYSPEVNGRKNLSGAGNYMFLEAKGQGHVIGVTQAVLQNQDGWFGEGDDMIFIDGDKHPTIQGTGTEDYYNGAWDFNGAQFANLREGAPLVVNPEKIGGKYCLYRWHTESPITFEKSIRVTMEHGHANHRADDFFTVAYWYQTEPHAQFPALPKAEDRIPRVYAVGGAGAQALPKD